MRPLIALQTDKVGVSTPILKLCQIRVTSPLESFRDPSIFYRKILCIFKNSTCATLIYLFAAYNSHMSQKNNIAFRKTPAGPSANVRLLHSLAPFSDPRRVHAAVGLKINLKSLSAHMQF